MMTLPFINFHTHHPAYEGEISLGGEECGLDRRWSVSPEEQEQAFLLQIAESEREGKALIIHCVRALDDILRIHRQTKPHQPWMLHGFRGKPQQLKSLLSAGIYISFGIHYNRESMLLCPLDMMCLETDDIPQPIKPLYQEISSLRGINLEELQAAMIQNARKITQNESFCAIL